MDRTRRLAMSLVLNLGLVVAQVASDSPPTPPACWPTPATI